MLVARGFCPLLSVVVIVFILSCLWFPVVDWVARVVNNFRLPCLLTWRYLKSVGISKMIDFQR